MHQKARSAPRSSSARARLHPSACARSRAFWRVPAPAVHPQQGSNAGTSSAQALPARPAWRRSPCPRGLRVPGSSGKFPEVGIAPCPLPARASRLALARSAWGASAAGRQGKPAGPERRQQQHSPARAHQKARQAPAAARQGAGLHRPAAACSVAPWASLRLAGAPAGSARGGAQSRRLAALVEWRLIQLHEGSLI